MFIPVFLSVQDSYIMDIDLMSMMSSGDDRGLVCCVRLPSLDSGDHPHGLLQAVVNCVAVCCLCFLNGDYLFIYLMVNDVCAQPCRWHTGFMEGMLTY